MCRLLAVRAEKPFAAVSYLADFAAMCWDSKEYQGHGWGLACRRDGQWFHYRHIQPVWEDDLTAFGDCDFLLVHARSAFQDEGILVENNMPFHDDRHIFLFNGELRGVGLKMPGRIGAEKIFNTIKRFNQGDLGTAFQRATQVILGRSQRARAMNIVMTDLHKLYVHAWFSEDPDYFTLYQQRTGATQAVCSQPLRPEWHPIPNQTTLVF